MSDHKSTAIVTGAILVLALGSSTAYAATSGAAGSDSARRAPAAKHIGTATGSGFVDNGGTTDPSDDVIVAVTRCPARSQATGGGASDGTNGVPFVSAPLGARTWVVVSTADPADTSNNPADLVAFARCFNPRRNVPNVTTHITARQMTPALRQLARKSVGR